MQRAVCLIAGFLFVLVFHLPAYPEDKGGPFYDFGVFAFEDRDFPDAEKNFLKALRFNPDNPLYNHFLGKTYLSMERYPEAEKYLQIARKLDPDLSGSKYDLALLYFKTSHFDQAADLFIAAGEEEPGNVLAAYYAGISLYQMKKYARALPFFLQASEKSPSIKDTGYFYAGICHQKMGDLAAAVEKLRYVKDNAESDSLRNNAAQWLEAIEKYLASLKPYSIYFKGGYQYDSNVKLEPLSREDRVTDKDDFLFNAYLSGTYNFVEKGPFILGAGYSHYQTFYRNMTELDLIGSIFSIYAKYRKDPFIFGFNYIPSYYWLDNESYAARHQLRPEVSWSISPNLLSRLSYTFTGDNNFQDSKLVGHSHQGAVDLFYSIGTTGIYIFTGFDYEHFSAAEADKGYDQLEMRLGVNFALPSRINLTLTGRYASREYGAVAPGQGVKREDDKYQGSIALSRKLFYEWLEGWVDYSRIRVDSTIDDSSYEKSVATVSLAIKF